MLGELAGKARADGGLDFLDIFPIFLIISRERFHGDVVEGLGEHVIQYAAALGREAHAGGYLV
jgi:hypothetical protein